MGLILRKMDKNGEKKVWIRQDSNLWPKDKKSDALPTELPFKTIKYVKNLHNSYEL